MPAHVVLASCEPLPPFDPEHQELIDALGHLGIRAFAKRWDDPRFDWGLVDAVVIRSTWDYHLRREEFLAWADRVARVTPLWNPAPLVRWNSHKRYLDELARDGIPIVPTLWVAQGAKTDLSALFDRADWSAAVAKPAVSAGAHQTIRFERHERARAVAHVLEVARAGDVMLQPYLRAVERHGERSLVYVGGEFSHAVRRQPALLGPEVALAPATPVPASREERELAERVLARLGQRCLYARVDLVPTDGGAPLVMELELIEPTLFFKQAPAAALRFAQALQERL